MSGSGYTKFNDYSHAELRKMAQALNPGEVMAASDPWRRAADTLKAIRATLTRASTEAAVSWEGSTSDAFHKRMLNLAATINNAASYANDAANTLKHLSEAIAQAKHDMPEEPSGWEQFTDGVGDTVSAVFGGDDEDTKTAVAEQKKAEAAAVMQTLAMHYRVAAPMLKPPPPVQPPKGEKSRGDLDDATSSGDSTGEGAFSAMMAGAGYTSTAAAPKSSGSSKPSLSQRPAAQSAPKRSTPAGPAAPTDSGIKGGTVHAAPKPPSVTNYGPGTGIDGTTVNPSGTPGTSPLSTNPANPTSNPGTPIGLTTSGDGGGPGPTGGGPIMGGQAGQGNNPGKGSGTQNKDVLGGTASVPGKAAGRGGKAFGAGEVLEGGFGTGGRAVGARPGGGLSGRTGGIVGGGARPGSGSGAKQAFTEGGSGLGARGRARGELGANAAGGMAPGMPLTDAQRRKKEKGKDGKRPDYLVEDEETWASDKPANPNVVE
ncbi:WXG100 family type VII secretion target [Kitasatospora sp. RG8]|uniref:WXG100 family type VII secretion target n=1 Tax=Kitasatospora sp. RG8 TaxID=2820815 RepID=UPI0021128398|nr:WXG100 family type VII secretion target [Kitasatospora sp. RG8]